MPATIGSCRNGAVSRTVENQLNIYLLWFISALLLAFKSPDSLVKAQFWAEDGAVFFAPQLESIWPLLFEPYAGYLHVIPRFVAWLASWLDINWQPFFYNAAALVIDSFVIAYVALRWHFTGSKLTILLAFFVVPTAGDIFGTVTNVQWFLQFALLAACTRLPGENRQRRSNIFGFNNVAASLMIFAAALTGPFSLLWVFGVSVTAFATMLLRTQGAPLHRPIADRLASIDFVRYDRFAILCMGAAIQILVMTGQRIETPEAAHSLPWPLLEGLGLTEYKHPYVQIVNFPWSALHLMLSGFYLTCLAISAVTAFRRQDDKSILLFTLMYVGCFQPLLAYSKQHAFHTLSSPSHYFYLWAVSSVWVSTRLVEHALPVRPLIIPSALAAALLMGIWTWPDHFRRAPLRDLDWRQQAAVICRETSRRLAVPLNPLPWHMVIGPTSLQPRGCPQLNSSSTNPPMHPARS